MKVLMLDGSSRSSSAPTVMSRSINIRVGSSFRDCAVLGPPQLLIFTVHVRPVGMGADGKSQGCYAPSLWWFHSNWLNSHFNSCRLSFRSWKAFSSVDARSRLIMKLWPFVVKAHRGNHWMFLFIKDHESFPRPDTSAFPAVSSDDLLHPMEGWFRATALESQITLLFGGKKPWSTHSKVLSLTCVHIHSQYLNILCPGSNIS
jgi:hypothetical protein